MRMVLVIALVTVACGSPAAAPVPSTPGPPTPTATPLQPGLPATPSPVPTRTPRRSGAIHYVAIGASDTVGIGAIEPAKGSWPSRLAALLPEDATYANLGVSGSLTGQAVVEQLPRAVREKPTLVTIWLAVNDMNAGIPPQAHAAEMKVLIDALVAGTGARIFVGNVPDLRPVPVYADADPEVLAALIEAYNDGITLAASAHGERVTVVDLFTGSAELMTDVTVAADGFHPSDAGYILIAERFEAAMRLAGIGLRARS